MPLVTDTFNESHAPAMGMRAVTHRASVDCDRPGPSAPNKNASRAEVGRVGPPMISSPRGESASTWYPRATSSSTRIRETKRETERETPHQGLSSGTYRLTWRRDSLQPHGTLTASVNGELG